MRKIPKTLKFEKTENTEKVKRSRKPDNRSWEQKKTRENVTVKKGENGDKAETHSVSIFRASAISNHVQSVVAYNGGAQCP
jgi:hypothetical protein